MEYEACMQKALKTLRELDMPNFSTVAKSYNLIRSILTR
jgi:hypothetical protein